LRRRFSARNSLVMCESMPGNADSHLRDWDPGYLAVKENGCSCDDGTDGRS